MSALFNNDIAACGPSNPLLSLSKHTNNDNTFLRSTKRLNGSAEQQQQLFNNRHNRIDTHLDQEYQQFSNHNIQPHQFHPLQNLPILPSQQQQHAFPLPGASLTSTQWSQDFSKLSLNENSYTTPTFESSIQQPYNTTTTSTWNQEFSHPQHQIHHQPPHHIISTNLLLNQPKLTGHLTEHQELHKVAAQLEQQDEQFGALFDQIEREISKPEEKQQPIISQADYDKDRFAQTAKLVANAMSQKTRQTNAMSKKFENSNFLKLMNQISEKSVVINGEGDAFVTNKEVQDS